MNSIYSTGSSLEIDRLHQRLNDLEKKVDSMHNSRPGFGYFKEISEQRMEISENNIQEGLNQSLLIRLLQRH